MGKFNIGEVIKLDTGMEYACTNQIEKNGIYYICLVSLNKPIEVKFAKRKFDSNDDELIIIGSSEEKKYVVELFRDSGVDI